MSTSVIDSLITAAAEVMVTQPTGAVRADGAKVDLTLVPPELIEAVTGIGSAPRELHDWWRGTGPMNVDLVKQALECSGHPTLGALAVAEVLNFGAKKYAPRNWEKGLTYSCCYNSAMRHALKALGGEERDAESGLPHWAHFAWNVMAIYVFQERGRTDLDDREKAA